MTRAFTILCLIATEAFAQSPPPTPADIPVRIQMPNSQISDFIMLYRSLTKRKVWIDAELRFDRPMSIFSERLMPRAEAISLIRGTLLQEGIEIREVGDTEAFVSRASDPRILSLLPSPAPTGTPKIRGMIPRVSPSP